MLRDLSLEFTFIEGSSSEYASCASEYLPKDIKVSALENFWSVERPFIASSESKHSSARSCLFNSK